MNYISCFLFATCISVCLASDRSNASELRNKIKHGMFDTSRHAISSRPEGVEQTFDCKIKHLAFEFAKKIQGNTSWLQYVFDGLELGSKCNMTHLPVSVTPFASSIQNANNKPRPTNEYQIYVDVNAGNQFPQQIADGSYTKPFKEIQLGINKCMDINSRVNQISQCVVVIKKGKYVITKALELLSSNIHLSAEEGSIVTSDITVDNLQWEKYKSSLDTYDGISPLFEGITPKQSSKAISYIGLCANDSQCQEYCNSSMKCTSYAYFDDSTGEYAKQCYIRTDGMWNTVYHAGVKSGKKVLIYMVDMNHVPNLVKVDQIFINGRRAIRARFPNANPETMGLHTVPTGYVNNARSWLPPAKTADATEIHIEAPVRSGSLFAKFTLGLDGPVKQFNPPASYWGTKSPIGGSSYRVPSGLQYSSDLEINERTWKKPHTGVVHVFQSAHWGNWMYRLDSRDQKSKTLHWTWGGFQEARGSHQGKEWYVENIFEELDSANEWFFDEDSKILYYSPNLTATNLPTQISIPQITTLLKISGSQRNPVRNVTIVGITFEHTTQTFLEPYMVPSGGDWSVHPNGLVFIEGSVGAAIKKCTFDSPGGNGIFVSNYNRDLELSENVFFRLGDNGIVLVGDTHLMDGTQGEQPRGVIVRKNLLFENGVWGKQSYAFVQSRSCESTLDRNIFFNGPRAGININDGFGGGNLINNSLLFNFVRETSDHGPINTWDRVPYFTRMYDGETASLAVKENNIHYNFVINNYRSKFPIDHDDGSCYWNDTHNYMVYGGYKNYLGHDIRSMYNIYVYPDKNSGNFPRCMMSAGQQIGTSGYGEVYSHNKCISERSDVYSLGSCQSQYLSMLLPYLSDNQYYTKNGEITAQCGSEKWNFIEMVQHGMESGTIVETLVDDDTVIDWGRDLLEI